MYVFNFCQVSATTALHRLVTSIPLTDVSKCTRHFIDAIRNQGIVALSANQKVKHHLHSF